MANASMRKYLRDKISELEAERQRITADLEAFQRVLARVETEDEDEDKLPAKGLVNEIWRIMSGAGEAMHYRDVYRVLQERGVHIPGKDPMKNVGAHMSADPRFASLGGGRWGLRSWGGARPSVPPESARRPEPTAPVLIPQPDLRNGLSVDSLRGTQWAAEPEGADATEVEDPPDWIDRLARKG